MRVLLRTPCAKKVIGELFLGRPFGGLDSGKSPQFLDDIDLFFIVADLQWNNPVLATLLSYVPLKSVRYFLGAMQRLADVSNTLSARSYALLIKIVWREGFLCIH